MSKIRLNFTFFKTEYNVFMQILKNIVRSTQERADANSRM
jgi:hypothetical protein